MESLKPTEGTARAPRFYRPELDALRFMAFLCVFLHHLLLILDPARYTGFKASLALVEVTVRESMAYGVCLFFFLSSFLITSLLLSEQDRTGNIHIARFYIRRILRIWPLYFAFIGGVLLISIFVPAIRTPKAQVFALLILLGNWYTARLDWAGAGHFSMLWSISIEEQFYLLFPFLLKVGGRRRLFLLCPIVVLVSCGTIYWLKGHGAGWYYAIWTNSFTQFQFFGWGALAAIILRQGSWQPARAQRIALFIAGFACWFSSRARPVLPSSPLLVTAGYLLVALGCLCFFLGIYRLDADKIPGWLRYLGKISYGLYIFHVVGLNVSETLIGRAERNLHGAWHLALLPADGALGLCLTIGMAALSYRYLESPFLRLKDRFEVVRSRNV